MSRLLKRAFRSIAADTGQSIEQLAEDVIAVANEHMAQALRAISIKRGIDPAGHVLLSFGGAGGLHVCALADALGMSKALVPRYRRRACRRWECWQPGLAVNCPVVMWRC